MSEVMLDATGAMRQAGMTAEHYLNAAIKILRDNQKGNFAMSDAIQLSKVMAMDFDTSMMCMKMQEIRDAIDRMTEEGGR